MTRLRCGRAAMPPGVDFPATLLKPAGCVRAPACAEGPRPPSRHPTAPDGPDGRLACPADVPGQTRPPRRRQLAPRRTPPRRRQRPRDEPAAAPHPLQLGQGSLACRRHLYPKLLKPEQAFYGWPLMKMSVGLAVPAVSRAAKTGRSPTVKLCRRFMTKSFLTSLWDSWHFHQRI